MSYTISITRAEPQQIAAVRVRTHLGGIADAIGTGFGRIMPAIGRSGTAPSGAPMVIYHEMIDQENDGEIEIAMPVGKSITRDADVYGRELEGGEMATVTHRGPYEELRAAYAAIMNWVGEQAYEFAGPPREIYLNDPTEVAPGEILTRIEFPVRRPA